MKIFLHGTLISLFKTLLWFDIKFHSRFFFHAQIFPDFMSLLEVINLCGCFNKYPNNRVYETQSQIFYKIGHLLSFCFFNK